MTEKGENDITRKVEEREASRKDGGMIEREVKELKRREVKRN